MVTLVSSHTALVALFRRQNFFQHVEYNNVLVGSILFDSCIRIGDLVPLLKFSIIFEYSLFPAWWLDSFISAVESPVYSTASQDLGESNVNAR